MRLGSTVKKVKAVARWHRFLLKSNKLNALMIWLLIILNDAKVILPPFRKRNFYLRRNVLWVVTNTPSCYKNLFARKIYAAFYITCCFPSSIVSTQLTRRIRFTEPFEFRSMPIKWYSDHIGKSICREWQIILRRVKDTLTSSDFILFIRARSYERVKRTKMVRVTVEKEERGRSGRKGGK